MTTFQKVALHTLRIRCHFLIYIKVHAGGGQGPWGGEATTEIKTPSVGMVKLRVHAVFIILTKIQEN